MPYDWDLIQPDNPHQEIYIDVTRYSILIVGDVHGCKDEMNELINLARKNLRIGLFGTIYFVTFGVMFVSTVIS